MPFKYWIKRKCLRIEPFFPFISFIFLVYFGGMRSLSDDVLAIYRQAIDVWAYHQFSVTGPRVVFTGMEMPGSLQSILFGIPLLFSNGYIFGTLFFLSGLTVAGHWLLIESFLKRFPDLQEDSQRLCLKTAIYFCPWLAAFFELWNPSFALPFSLLFVSFWIHPGLTKYRYIIAGFAAVCILQLHLSFVLIPLAVFLGCLIEKQKPEILKTSIGMAFGAVTIIPWFIKKNQFLNQSVLPSSTQGGFLDWFLVHIQFQPLNGLSEFLKGFFRFLSFPSADLMRFLGNGEGYLGAFKIYENWGYKLIIFLSLIFSCVLIVVLFKSVLHFLWNQKENAVDRWTAWMSLASFVPFWFSIRGTSAHTYWILLPWTFCLVRSKLHQAWFRKLVYLNFVFGFVLLFFFIHPIHSGSIRKTYYLINEVNMVQGRIPHFSQSEKPLYEFRAKIIEERKNKGPQ